MYRLFAVMYLICTLYSTSPALDDNLAVKCLAAEDPSSLVKTLEKPVEAAQAMKQLGFLKEEEGSKDLLFRNAVLRFQSCSNMVVTGKWEGKYSENIIRMLLEEELTYPDTVDAPPSEDYWITINKTKRILTLYKNDKVVSKYPVAIGKDSSVTPEGKFNIFSKVINPVWGGGGYAKPVKGGSPANPLGYRWMGLSVNGGSRYGIHGNNSPYSIGKNISHGCIRMINYDVEELFKIIPAQAPVWIGSEKTLNEWGVFQDEQK